eukprot:9467936-Pyramimonas_sp.AAC.1
MERGELPAGVTTFGRHQVFEILELGLSGTEVQLPRHGADSRGTWRRTIGVLFLARTYGARKELAGESNSRVIRWLNMAL